MRRVAATIVAIDDQRYRTDGNGCTMPPTITTRIFKGDERMLVPSFLAAVFGRFPGAHYAVATARMDQVGRTGTRVVTAIVETITFIVVDEAVAFPAATITSEES